MRPIEFRAWNKATKEMDYDPVVFGSHESGECWINGSLQEAQEFPFSWVFMQWTGLKDKNGKKIFEGDICRHKNQIGVVTWNEDGWSVGWDLLNTNGDSLMEHYGISKEMWEECEVIGHKYQEEK